MKEKLLKVNEKTIKGYNNVPVVTKINNSQGCTKSKCMSRVASNIP